MATVTIYTQLGCPYCVRAKALLDEKNVSYDEIDIMREPQRRLEMIERSNGGKTVPQIFINGQHIGGCDELFAKEQANQLDNLLT